MPEFRTRFHYTALNRSVELGRVGFRTAEAAGGTLILLPEARYKTSFYSMLGRVGQTRKDGSHGVARAPPPAAFDVDFRHHAGEGARATQKLPSFAFPHEPLRPERPVQRSVLNGLRDVFGLDGGGAFEVGNSAGYL